MGTHKNREALGPLREEAYLLKDGLGRIEVAGTSWESALRVDGKPIVFRSPDGGSIGHELLLARPLPADATPADLWQIVAEPPGESPLHKTFAPLLRQFTNGQYRLILERLHEGRDVYLWEHGDATPLPMAGYHYPYGSCTLVATLPETLLDDGRVLEWMYAIEAGARPVVITTSVEDAKYKADYEYVIDGHHKLIAYLLCGIEPLRLLITRMLPSTE